ncbi:endonuclease/exonuclease/phosphatase family protein [Pontibacter sp. CAU 1760]
MWLGFNIGVVFWILAGVLCLQVPPQAFWPAGFVAFSLPAALVLNFLFLLYWMLRRSWLLVLPLAVLVLAWGYYARLLSINFAEDVPEGAKTLQVLSFNTHMFNLYSDDGQERVSSVEMADWIATHPADVYCLQEFYSKRGSDRYNTISRIGVRYDKNRYFSVARSSRKDGDVGIAIFSRFPILNKGDINFSNRSSANRVIWADLQMGNDTIRVYASHLQSMSIKTEDIEDTYSAISNKDSFESRGRNLARRLRSGFVARGKQVEVLLEHVRESPYRSIVCGDFNDIPFSYTYNELAKELDNSFVKAGSGVGATYNGPLPFLRIDNQFYTNGLRAIEFQTHHEMSLSDHFPISARYVVEPRNQKAR